MPMTDPLTALFAGDSITDADRLSDPAALGRGYVRLIAEIAAGRADPLRVVNAGVSGDRVVDLAARWQSDVIDERPDILTVLIGVNDTWRRYDSGDPTSAVAFERGYAELLDAALTSGIQRLVLMEPFLIPIDAAQEQWRTEDLDAKIAATRALAERFDATLIGLDGLLNDAARQDGSTAIAADGVHPTDVGHELIARAWWEAIAPLRP
jgi:acyl-CoA thioesterase I